MMSIFIYEYNLKTQKFKKKAVNEEITEEDHMISQEMGLKLFSNYTEMIQFHEKHQVTSSIQNNIIYNKDTEDVTEIKRDITDETIDIEKSSWGGKRNGAGGKLGQKKSQETKEKMSLAKKGNQNAKKDTQK